MSHAQARFLLVCCLLLIGLPHATSAPAPYGATFVRVGESWPDAGPAQSLSQSAPATVQEADDFRARLLALEQQGGPYADALAEPLADLGRHHRQLGDLAQAQQLYRRALHVVRINDGLYSERQLPILRALLDSYRSAGDMQALDARYDYYFRLFGSGQAPYTEVRLRAALEYLRWQREALRLGVDNDDKPRLLALYQLNVRLLQEVYEDTSVPHRWYRELAFSQLRNLYLIENRIEPRIETIGSPSSLPLFASNWTDEDFRQKRLQVIQQGSLGRGRALMQQLMQRSSNEPPVEQARVHMELADWNQWNGQYTQARESYARVEQLLRSADRQDLLQQWLAQPVELPDNGAFWQPRHVPDDKRRVVLQASYDVSARGRVKNIQATTSDPQDEALASRFKRGLAKTRFRPRFVDGEPRDQLQVTRVYELVD